MQVIVSGLLTTYEESSSGKAIILLHGWGDDHHTFKKLSEKLGKSYHVVALDLPGFGGTEAPDAVWGLDDYAQFVSKFVAKLGLSPYAFLAHSNGGSVAIKGLATDMLHAEKLVLLASAGIRNRQKFRRQLVKIVAKTGKTATFWLGEGTKKKLRKKLYGVAGSDLLVAPHLQETFKKTVRQDVQQDATMLSLKTLLIYGDNDTATPPLYGEIYEGLIKKSKLEIIPGAGHFVHHDKPDEVAAKVQDFLNG